MTETGSRQVRKYEIPLRIRVTRWPEISEDAELLHAAEIEGRFYVWALESEKAVRLPRKVSVYLTGDAVLYGYRHVSTFVSYDGTDTFVGHVFDGGMT